MVDFPTVAFTIKTVTTTNSHYRKLPRLKLSVPQTTASKKEGGGCGSRVETAGETAEAQNEKLPYPDIREVD